MAANRYRPGRTLGMFFLGMAIAYGLVALAGTWKPALGLDLQGGTRIQLEAKGDVTPESLDQAAQIIDSRVNGSGVSEAEVTTADDRYVIVEIPGSSRADLVDTVARQAQLRTIEAIDNQQHNYDYTAKQIYRGLYGTDFPS